MTHDNEASEGTNLQGPATKKYRPSNVAPPPEEELRHEGLGGKVTIQETSGVAAAEATGKLQPDADEDPQETAGSG